METQLARGLQKALLVNTIDESKKCARIRGSLPLDWNPRKTVT